MRCSREEGAGDAKKDKNDDSDTPINVRRRLLLFWRLLRLFAALSSFRGY
jgi:hypothetical protein